jgi:hypothetical protein
MNHRKTRYTGVRIFEDQLEDLKKLIIEKHRNRLTIADLIREALDQYIAAES